MAFQIVILGLWAYPVVAFLLLWLTKKRSAMRRKIFVVSGVSAALTLLALLTHISTTTYGKKAKLEHWTDTLKTKHQR